MNFSQQVFDVTLRLRKSDHTRRADVASATVACIVFSKTASSEYERLPSTATVLVVRKGSSRASLF